MKLSNIFCFSFRKAVKRSLNTMETDLTYLRYKVFVTVC